MPRITSRQKPRSWPMSRAIWRSLAMKDGRLRCEISTVVADAHPTGQNFRAKQVVAKGKKNCAKMSVGFESPQPKLEPGEFEDRDRTSMTAKSNGKTLVRSLR